MSQSVTLHQFEISPFCQKVAKALQHKGIAFETVDYNGVLAAKAQTLSKVGKLPVLDIDGQRIQDSTRIVRYLDQAYPDLPRLYPHDPLLNAQVELWEDWSDELLYWYEVYFRVNDAAALKAAVAVSVLGRPTHEKFLAQPLLKVALKTQLYFQGLGKMNAADVQAEFLRHLDRIEQVLAQTGWLVGTDKTIADLAVGTQLAEVVRTSQSMGAEILARPNIAAWLKQL
ncbi:MAG: glutathione S-transferase family protein [Pseudomonadota bacterium]|nr:glutathione S-transferase family protein [Pseudomonadota bacterium]